MQNTVSLDERIEGVGLAPHGAVAPAPTAATSLARLGGRTARREFVFDICCLGTLALVVWWLAPLVGAPAFRIQSAALLVVVTLAVYAAASVFATVQRPSPALLDESKRIAASTLGALGIWFLLSSYLVDQVVDYRLANLLVAWVVAATTSTLLVQRTSRSATRRANPDRVLVIGAGAVGQTLARRIKAHSQRHGQVVGFYDEHPLPLHPSLEGLPVFDESQALSSVVEDTGATRLIIAFSHRSAEETLETIRNSRFGAIPVSVIPRYFELVPQHANLSDLDGMPLLELQSARLSRGARLVKRTLDVCVAGAGLILLSPVIAVIAIAIKIGSPGPAFFGQARTGQNGRTFTIWKFRTMVQDAESQRHALSHLNDMQDSGPLFKIRDDPRVTRIGRVLRRFSIDELPQLWNVLDGSMSLVGPRPFVEHEADQMDGWSRRRLDLTPGITGLWQVRGRNDVSYEEMIRLDYLYVTTWSVWWDIRILLETVPLVFHGRGAS